MHLYLLSVTVNSTEKMDNNIKWWCFGRTKSFVAEWVSSENRMFFFSEWIHLRQTKAKLLLFTMMLENARCVTLNQKFKWHFLLFFLFGQNARLRDNIPCKRLVFLIPTIVAIFFIVISAFGLCTEKFENLDIRHGFMVHFLILVPIIPGLSAVMQSVRMSKGTQAFANIINSLVEILEKQTFTQIAWEKFRKRITFKITLIVTWHLFSAFFRLVWMSPFYGRRFEIFASLILLYRMAAVYHMVFYVDLLTLLSSTIVQSVTKHRQNIQKKKSWQTNEIINFMLIVKTQHMQLWECIQVLNKHFGLIAVAIMIEAMFTTTSNGYWSFFYWTRGEKWLVVTRKYYLDFCFSISKVKLSIANRLSILTFCYFFRHCHWVFLVPFDW